MKSDFSHNIKALRKLRHMTQEQLAEAMGITAGAIYKWEQGLSLPDVELMMDLAGYFDVSLDALVGFQACAQSKAQILLELKRIRLEKCYENAWDSLERWLKRFPNDFDIVYNCAVLYHLAGSETQSIPHLTRAIALLERSAGLIGQNRDPEISETLLYQRIGTACLDIGKTQEGLACLRTHNPCGVNNDLLGLELSENPQGYREAESRLGSALIQCTLRLRRIAIGNLNLLSAQGRKEEATRLLLWMIHYLEGLQSEQTVSFLDKDNAVLKAMCAAVFREMGDRSRCTELLRQARRDALHFDAAPDYTSRNIRYCGGFEPVSSFDGNGVTATEAVAAALSEELPEDDEILQIWRAVCHEP